GARLLRPVELQEYVGEAQDRAGRLSAAPENRFRQSVVGAMGKRIPVDHQQRLARRGGRLPYRRSWRGLRRGFARILSRRRLLAQLDPGRGMIACAFSSTNLPIDVGIDQALGRLGAQEQMIDA